MPIIRLKTFSRPSAPFLLALISVFSLQQVSGQCVAYTLGDKGDTLNCLDKKDLRQGPWVIHVDALRGEPGYEEEGVFVDGVKDGKWRQYDLAGDLIAVENYRYGSKDGLQEYFTNVGDRLREESWMSVNPKNPYDTVTVYDDPHNPFKSERKVIKLDAATVRQGTWSYFDPSTGTVAKTEKYVLGKLQDGGLTQTAPVGAGDKPKEVEDYEKKNAGKKKINIRTGETGGD
jgi:hypothetical protein